MTAAPVKIMLYILSFKHGGKQYVNYQHAAEKALDSEYEAVACGLLLGEIEKHGMNREDRYVDVALVELDENDGVINIVWSQDVYYAISQELK